MSEFEIRKLSPAEIDQWFVLRIKALRAVPSAFGSNPEHELRNGVEFYRQRIVEGGETNVIFGAWAGSQLVGVAGVVKQSREKQQHKADIWGMFVDDWARGKGLGRRLLDACVNHAASLGSELVNISVEASNKAACHLYVSYGFESWGVEPRSLRIDGAYFDTEHFTLFLDK